MNPDRGKVYRQTADPYASFKSGNKHYHSATLVHVLHITQADFQGPETNAFSWAPVATNDIWLWATTNHTFNVIYYMFDRFKINIPKGFNNTSLQNNKGNENRWF